MKTKKKVPTFPIDARQLFKTEREYNAFLYLLHSNGADGMIINGRDEKDIDAEVNAKEKINKNSSSELTTRLKKMILSVDGKTDRAFINGFVDNEFLSRDSLAFRQHVKTVTPDLDFDITLTDSSGKEIEVTIPITLRFFWPDA